MLICYKPKALDLWGILFFGLVLSQLNPIPKRAQIIPDMNLGGGFNPTHDAFWIMNSAHLQLILV
jgi:hypothetical protein